jgi:hypothetical protein
MPDVRTQMDLRLRIFVDTTKIFCVFILKNFAKYSFETQY